METITGKIIRTVFFSEESGYKVIMVQAPSGACSTVTGEFGPEIIPGSVATFHGDYKTHSKYGRQFKTSAYTITYDSLEMSSIKLFIDAMAPNIGPERSELIVGHFGKDTIDVLDKEPHRLSEVRGIGEKLSAVITKAWNDNRDKWRELREEYTVRAFLNSLGIREKRIKKILSYFGGGMAADTKIRENPYVLCEIDGFGFTSADHIAKQLGIPEESPNRVKAFVLYSLEILCPSNGHLYLLKSDILKLIRQYSHENSTQFLGGNVKDEDLEDIIKKLLNENKITVSGDAIYSKVCYDYEDKSASYLANIMNKPSDLIFINKDDVEEHITTFERENGITLSPEQKTALHYFVEKKVFIITGSPGTGKTTILKAVVSLIKKLRLNLTCMTPTGISAKKLSTTVDYDAYTIHRRLGFKGKFWTHCEINPFDTDVVILDESSMIDQEVFYRLLAALKNRVHIIFVGDDNQLPSVGAGNVLREMISCQQIPTVRLEQIFRQNEASDIIKAAHKIKNGDTDLSLFKPDPKADVFFMRESEASKIEKIIVALAQKFKNERRQFQIITARNDGPLSVDTLNTLLQGILNPPAFDLNEIKCYNYILRRGDRIIVRKNDYENSIFNGDIGKVTSINSGFIDIEIDNRIIQLSVEELEDKVKLAYAITVHKSQGQEYPFIILPFINQFGSKLLQRNLLYTAITRAKEKVIVLGHGSALEKAINNASVTRRNTLLGEHIKSWLQKKTSNLKDSLPTLPGEPVSSPPATPQPEPSSSGEEKYSLTDIIGRL